MKKQFWISVLLFLSVSNRALAQFDASYLIPTNNVDLQPLALAPVNGANLVQQEDGTWSLDYHLPWTIAGAEPMPIQASGELDKLRSSDGVTRADCSKDASDIPTELTQNLGTEFAPEIVCHITYKHDLVIQLSARTGDFIDLVNQNFGHDEAMNRLFLRDQFMGEPIGFLGLKRSSSDDVNY